MESVSYVYIRMLTRATDGLTFEYKHIPLDLNLKLNWQLLLTCKSKF